MLIKVKYLNEIISVAKKKKLKNPIATITEHLEITEKRKLSISYEILLKSDSLRFAKFDAGKSLESLCKKFIKRVECIKPDSLII